MKLNLVFLVQDVIHVNLNKDNIVVLRQMAEISS